MPHKKILFMYYLSPQIKQELKEKKFDLSSYIEKISLFADVHEGITNELLARAEQYSVVIILGHEMMGCIQVAEDNLFPIVKLPEAFPQDFSGIIDASFCQSEVIHDALKQRFPKAKVNTSFNFTQIELRITLYSLLLTHPDLKKENYLKWYNRIKDVLLEEQDHRDPEVLSKLEKTTKLGTTIECSAKEKVCKMAPFPISIHILPDHENGSLRIERVIQARPDYVKLSMNLKKGDEIAVDITFSTEPCELCDEYSKYLHCKEITPKSVIWDETTDALITFKCNVSNEFPLGAFDAIITMKVNGEEILRDWNINIEVDNNNNGTNKMPNVPEQDRLPNDVELSYTDIKGYENKTTDEITEEIDKKINKAKQLEKEGMVVASSILDDYNELKRIIISSDRVLENQRKTICLLNKRLGMLDSLQKIRSEIDPNPSGLLKVDLVKLQDSIAKITGEFFSPINDSFLETIYVKNDGTKVHKFYRDEYTKAYRVLAIKLAVPLIDKKIIHYYVPQESTDKEVCPRVDDESSRSVNNRGLDYINILLKNNSIRTQLENYLKTTEGKSSVIAFYLLELYKHNV